MQQREEEEKLPCCNNSHEMLLFLVNWPFSVFNPISFKYLHKIEPTESSAGIEHLTGWEDLPSAGPWSPHGVSKWPKDPFSKFIEMIRNSFLADDISDK